MIHIIQFMHNNLGSICQKTTYDPHYSCVTISEVSGEEMPFQIVNHRRNCYLNYIMLWLSPRLGGRNEIEWK